MPVKTPTDPDPVIANPKLDSIYSKLIFTLKMLFKNFNSTSNAFPINVQIDLLIFNSIFFLKFSLRNYLKFS